MSHAPSETAALDVRERGAPVGDQPQTLDSRLFMQLLAFECVSGLTPTEAVRRLSGQLSLAHMPAVIYVDVNHPTGLALLTYSEDPSDFVSRVRVACNSPEVAGLRARPELSMLGRTYSTGFEQDLRFWLLDRPRQTVQNPAWPWAVWYPLRRKGSFELLDPKEKGGIMREHGGIGRTYGEADLAHDVRLACHGLDANDNEFVIGLVSKDLYPLSHVVQAMRRTRQTAEFMEKMGPFFVGHAVWRNAGG